MTVTELPEAWRADRTLAIVAHIRRTLASLVALVHFAVHVDEDEFSRYFFVHLAVDGTPVALIEHEDAPGYVYVHMPKDVGAPEVVFGTLRERLAIAADEVPWVSWSE